jgi:hypothetical protein
MNSDLLDQGTSVGRRGLLSALFFASAFFCHPCFGLVVKVETIGSFENPQNSKRVLAAEKMRVCVIAPSRLIERQILHIWPIFCSMDPHANNYSQVHERRLQSRQK